MSAYRVVSRVADLSDGATVVTTDASQTITGAKTLTARLSQTAPSDNIVTVLSPYTADPTTGVNFYTSIVPQSNAGLGGAGYDQVYTAGWNVIQSTLVDATQHGAGTSIEYGWYNGPDTTRQTEFHAIRFVKSNGDGTGTEFRALSSVSPWNDVGNIATDFTANTLRVSDQLGRVYYSLTSSAASSNAVVQWAVSHPNGANILDLYGDTDTTGQVNIGGSGNTVVLRMVDSNGDGRIVITPGPDPYIQFAGSTTPAHPQISFADNCSVYAYGGSLSLNAAAAMYCYVHTGSGGLVVKDVDNANATIFTVGASAVSTPLAIAPGNGSATGPAIWGGTGAPSSGLGANGDFYQRSDGTASGGTLYYHKESGSWVAFAGGGGSGTVTTTGTPSSGQMAKFSGSTSITTAVAGTDYLAPNGNGSALTGLTQSQISGLTTASSPTFAGLTATGSVAAGTAAGYPITIGGNGSVGGYMKGNASGFAFPNLASVIPTNGSAALADGSIDFGSSSYRFKQFYSTAASLIGAVATTSPLTACGATSQSVPLAKLQQLISGTAYDTGIIDAVWATDVNANANVAATRAGELRGYAADWTGTNRLGWSVASDGTQALVGFYGATPVAKAASPGTATGTDAAVINAIITILRNLGLCS